MINKTFIGFHIDHLLATCRNHLAIANLVSLNCKVDSFYQKKDADN